MAAARRPEELDAWQLSAALRDRVLKISATWYNRDKRLYDQIRDAAASAPRNLAEGFGFFKPRKLANHARIARASLYEVRDHLQDARTRKWIDKEEAASLLRLNDRAIGATTGLLRYLDLCKGKAPTDWDLEPPEPHDRSKKDDQENPGS